MGFKDELKKRHALIANTLQESRNVINESKEKLEGVGVNVPALNGGTTEPSATSVADTIENPYNKQVESYQALSEMIGEKPQPIETEEEKAAREKREQSKKVMAGLTDGLSALSNLYYTTKGAPSQQLQTNATNAMRDVIQRGYDERKAMQIKSNEDWQRRKEIADEKLNQAKLAQSKWIADREIDKENKRHEKEVLAMKHANTMEQIYGRGEQARQTEQEKHAGRVKLAQLNNDADIIIATLRQQAIDERNGATRSGTIVLSDGNKYKYNKSDEGALLSVYNKMVDDLSANDRVLKEQFENAKTFQQKISLLQQFTYKYPQYDAEIRAIIGKGIKAKPSVAEDDFSSYKDNQEDDFSAFKD